MTQMADFFQNLTLPSMPEVAHELIQTLNEADAPVFQVRDAIAKDPALTAKLLRLANSARYGMSREVASLSDAMTMVGAEQVRTLALSSCLNDAFPMVRGLSRETFWKESQVCAGYAQWLAKATEVDPQQAWLTAFMVRLGEVVIGQNIPDCLSDIERLPHFPGGRWERERDTLGFTECQVTAELARRWQFPKSMISALDNAADPSAAHPFNRLAGILHLAELLTGMDTTQPDTLDELPQDVLLALGLTHDWIKSHLAQAEPYIQTSSMG